MRFSSILRAGSVLLGVLFAVATLTRSTCAQTVYVAGTVFAGGGAGTQGRLGVLDLSSGSVSTIGSTGGVLLTGLALASDGTLYGSATNTSGQGVLYRVNRATGAVTQYGNTFNLGGSLTSITFGTGGQLFGLVNAASGQANLARFTLTTTPTATVSALSPAFASDGGLAFDGANLFATQGSETDALGNSSIYQISSASNSDVVLPGDPGFNGATAYALTFADGSLYAIDNGPPPGPGTGTLGGIYQVDPATGNGALVQTYDTAAFGAIYAASNVFTTPEPGTLALAAVVVGVLPFVRRKRR